MLRSTLVCLLLCVMGCGVWGWWECPVINNIAYCHWHISSLGRNAKGLVITGFDISRNEPNDFRYLQVENLTLIGTYGDGSGGSALTGTEVETLAHILRTVNIYSGLKSTKIIDLLDDCRPLCTSIPFKILQSSSCEKTSFEQICWTSQPNGQYIMAGTNRGLTWGQALSSCQSKNASLAPQASSSVISNIFRTFAEVTGEAFSLETNGSEAFFFKINFALNGNLFEYGKTFKSYRLPYVICFEDANECLDGSHKCPTGFSCTNTFGSYLCTRYLASVISSSSSVIQKSPKGNLSGYYIAIPRPYKPNNLTTYANAAKRCTQENMFLPPHSVVMSRLLSIYMDNVLRGKFGQRWHPQYYPSIWWLNDDRPGSRMVICIGSGKCDFQGCQNGGVCGQVSHGADFACQCKPGFTGAKCEADINECAIQIHDCSAGFKCKNTHGSFKCTDIDECAEPIQHCTKGFKCNNTPGSFKCTDIDECATWNHNCTLGFRCENTPGSFNCTDINFCASSACANGGTCVEGIFSYTCQCLPQFKGGDCQYYKDCDDMPCKHGGTCTPQGNMYRCSCVLGYTGASCETNINDCSSSACAHGGTCVDGVNTISCLCPPHHTGQNCEFLECNPPCRQHSECTEMDFVGSGSGSGFGLGLLTGCTCRIGFTGNATHCENIDECALGTHTCNAHSTCLDSIGGFNCLSD